MKQFKDQFSRPLRDLRISVTDRCNFRCRYCMPAEIFGADYKFLPKEGILRFGEIEKVARLLVKMGVRKLRITGGEPLLRRDLAVLVESLAQIELVRDIAMTSNGILLGRHAVELKAAGLQRVTISLDALDSVIFGAMNGVGAKSEKVIEGVDAALAAGLGVKVNSVVKKGVNESEVLPLVEFARSRDIPIRFIEYMDTGNSNQWQLDQVVPSAELLERLGEHLNLRLLSAKQSGETAVRYGLAANTGFEVGFISSVSEPFCGACNRMRLSADGKLYNCLFAATGLDVKAMLRGGTFDRADDLIRSFWQQRTDRYSMLRAKVSGARKQEMSYMGG